MLARTQSNRNSEALMEVQNGTATLEEYLTVSNKTDHTFTIRLGSSAPCCLPQCAENLCVQNPHMGIYNSLIHCCQDLGAFKMFFNR